MLSLVRQKNLSRDVFFIAFNFSERKACKTPFVVEINLLNFFNNLLWLLNRKGITANPIQEIIVRLTEIVNKITV